jgi:hypothetical protein
MLLLDRAKARVDKAVTEPIRNTAVLAIFATVVAIIALIVVVVRK